VQGTDDNDDDVHGSGVDDSYTSVLWSSVCTHGKPLCFINVLSFFHFLNDQNPTEFFTYSEVSK